MRSELPLPTHPTRSLAVLLQYKCIKNHHTLPSYITHHHTLPSYITHHHTLHTIIHYTPSYITHHHTLHTIIHYTPYITHHYNYSMSRRKQVKNTAQIISIKTKIIKKWNYFKIMNRAVPKLLSKLNFSNLGVGRTKNISRKSNV